MGRRVESLKNIRRQDISDRGRVDALIGGLGAYFMAYAGHFPGRASGLFIVRGRAGRRQIERGPDRSGLLLVAGDLLGGIVVGVPSVATEVAVEVTGGHEPAPAFDATPAHYAKASELRQLRLAMRTPTREHTVATLA
jgi:hypothetical protein